MHYLVEWWRYNNSIKYRERRPMYAMRGNREGGIQERRWRNHFKDDCIRIKRQENLLLLLLLLLLLPVLFYGNKTWTIKAKDARRITAVEMKYMRRTARYTWTDYITNTQIANELEITPILDKLLEYKRNWIQHVNRMPRNRLPRVMKRYSPPGRRNHDRPLKRLLDTWDRSGSTSGPTQWQIIIIIIIIIT